VGIGSTKVDNKEKDNSMSKSKIKNGQPTLQQHNVMRLLCQTGYKSRTDNITKGRYYNVLLIHEDYVVVLDDENTPSVFLKSFFNNA
jgi:hypothetical protein